MQSGIHRYEDLEVWQEGIDLAAEIYRTVALWRDWGLKDQMQRSAVSIPSNIAEGYERRSNREFVHHLEYAQGSAGELRTQIYLALRLGRIDCQIGEALVERTRKLSAMLHRYIDVRRSNF